MTGGTHLADLLRETDRERYLTTLYAPVDKRPALTALYAFNAEIAAIRDKIREPMAGEVRLQWWRDAITSGASTGNPLADALIETISTHHLPVSAFDRMLDARIFDLYDDPMPDRATLEGYCGETASTLIQLAAFILDCDAAANHADASGHGGCAQAITGLLRLLPLHRARGQSFLPADLLASVGVSSEQLISGDNKEGLVNAVQASVALAQEHLDQFAALAAGLPQSLRPAFLPLALVPAQLKAIGRNADRALGRSPEISAARTHFLLLAKAMRGW